MSTASPLPKIACPHCQGTMKSPGLPAGSKVNCPKCGQAFVLGGSQAAASPPRVPPVPPQKSAAPPAARPAAAVPPPKPAALPRPPTSAAGPQAPTRPRVLEQPLGPMDAIPTDALSAAMATQPAHRPPREDKLVDPNLLAPPKPKPKPQPTGITVVCRLCGTRMHAPLEKAGQTIQCPDCHTVNEIKAPAPPKEEKKSGPTLDDVPEFGMSDVVERPKYKPLVVPRGEDMILGNLEGADHPPGWSPPTAAPPASGGRKPSEAASHDLRGLTPPARCEGAPVAEGTLTFHPPPHEVDPEISLEAPVERIEIKPELPKAYLEPEAEDKLYDGKYDDDDMLGGGRVNPKSADAWKRAPFLYGLVEFLLYTTTLPSWLGLGLGAGVVLVIGNSAIFAAQDSSPLMQVSAMLLSMVFAVTMGLFIAPFFGACLAIVQETANGLKEVENWPNMNVTEWFFGALQIPAAAFVAGLPGFATTTFLLTGGMSLLFAPLPIVASWSMLFPIVLYSMLAENSVLSIWSSRTRESLTVASEAWLLFYMYSIGLGIIGGGAAVLAGVAFWPLTMVGAFGLVTIAFLYFRVLGRLMWYAEQKGLKRAQQSPAA
ncbi:MAG TPA: hypothetical protein VFV87_15035 [Pirellulaceae bacterium]|nr:hypothetical protein [Pirellulaceae bacterium]